MTHLHKDDLHDVDDCFAIDLLDSNLSIKLTPSGQAQAMKPDWFGYHILSELILGYRFYWQL